MTMQPEPTDAPEVLAAKLREALENNARQVQAIEHLRKHLEVAREERDAERDNAREARERCAELEAQAKDTAHAVATLGADLRNDALVIVDLTSKRQQAQRELKEASQLIEELRARVAKLEGTAGYRDAAAVERVVELEGRIRELVKETQDLRRQLDAAIYENRLASGIRLDNANLKRVLNGLANAAGAYQRSVQEVVTSVPTEQLHVLDHRRLATAIDEALKLGMT